MSNQTLSYRGLIKKGEAIVLRVQKDDAPNVPGGRSLRPLDPCTKVHNHSPDGFEWGYNGSGPAQLALAICVDVLGMNRVDEALTIYQSFKTKRIACLQQGQPWELDFGDVLGEIATLLTEQKSLRAMRDTFIKEEAPKKHVCKIQVAEGRLSGFESAVCETCGANHSWYCPTSPDHTCHYMPDMETPDGHGDMHPAFILIDGRSWMVQDHKSFSFSTCDFCGEPKERK